jgi:hypothetical protein
MNAYAEGEGIATDKLTPLSLPCKLEFIFTHGIIVVDPVLPSYRPCMHRASCSMLILTWLRMRNARRNGSNRQK